MHVSLASQKWSSCTGIRTCHYQVHWLGHVSACQFKATVVVQFQADNVKATECKVTASLWVVLPAVCKTNKSKITTLQTVFITYFIVWQFISLFKNKKIKKSDVPLTLLFKCSCVLEIQRVTGLWLVPRCAGRSDWFLCCQGSLLGFVEVEHQGNPSGCVYAYSCMCLCDGWFIHVTTAELRCHSLTNGRGTPETHT